MSQQASLFDFEAPSRAPGSGPSRASKDEETLTSHGYRIVTLAEFETATDVPRGNTRKVVRQLVRRYGGNTVVYEPGGDDRHGWLLVGDDRAALARETVEYRCGGSC